MSSKFKVFLPSNIISSPYSLTKSPLPKTIPQFDNFFSGHSTQYCHNQNAVVTRSNLSS